MSVVFYPHAGKSEDAIFTSIKSQRQIRQNHSKMKGRL